MDNGRCVSAILLACVFGACREAESPAGPDRPHPPVASGALSTAATPDIFTGAGNIGDCSWIYDEQTGQLLDSLPGNVFTLGDNAYPNGTATDYANCYDPSWGRHKARTWATLGNHDYDTGTAAAAFSYWGSRVGPSGKGYYSVNIGAWHIIVLNDAGKYTATNSYSPWADGSPQEQWLRADLAANTQPCTLAMWHVPLFLSSNDAGYTVNSEHQNLWNDLYAAQADVVLNGHQHHYERMAPMRPDGTRDDVNGIREFNVGTGGGDGLALPTVAIHPNSQVRAAVYGVLKLSFYADHYDWQFLPSSGQTFTDSGSQLCHRAGAPPPTNQPPVANPGGPYSTSTGTVQFDGSGSSDPDGNLPLTYAWSFGDGTTGTGVQPSHTYTANGTYTVTLSVTDSKGAQSSPASTTATFTAASNQPPVANPGGPYSTTTGTVQFDGNGSSDPDGNLPLTYAWTFGDGSTGTGAQPSHTYAGNGTYPVTLRVTDSKGAQSAPASTTATVNQPTTSMVLVGAGDIANCASNGDEATANLLDNISGTVFTTGDNVYNDGSTTDFNNCYQPSWGRHKSRTHPSPGAHDYRTSGASGYFNYFGALAGTPGKGYYSYDVGAWHVVALNSEIDISASSAQLNWLRNDLAASSKPCTVAYFYHPRFSSGTTHGGNIKVQAAWQVLYNAGAELILNGHEHNYERFGPQTPTGASDPQFGIREFVVGTGGSALGYPFGTPKPNSEVRNNTTFGVLELTLNSSGYSWRFVPIAGKSFTDSGSGTCH